MAEFDNAALRAMVDELREDAGICAGSGLEYDLTDKAADAIQYLLGESERLREIISECATACGAAVSPACSLEFMQQLPGEIAAVMGRHRANERDASRYQYLRTNARYEWRNGPGLYWYLPRGIQCSAAEQLDMNIDRQMAWSAEGNGHG